MACAFGAHALPQAAMMREALLSAVNHTAAVKCRTRTCFLEKVCA